MTNNAICVYDFTASKDKTDFEVLKNLLISHCKKWVFQLEKGEETGYEHYQGRFSLKIKKRLNECIKLFGGLPWKLSATSSENSDNDFYVTKEDTRIEGPWSDKDKVLFIPWHYDNIKLKPWQAQIIATKKIRNDRIIDILVDTEGCKGKSTVAAIGEILHGGVDLPPVNDSKELMQMICDICTDENNRDPGLIFFDMPRAVRKDQLYGLYSAIEQIKKGKLYDPRYHFKRYWIHSPRIWVFTNSPPDRSLLSPDRWRMWQLNEDEELVPYEMPAL